MKARFNEQAGRMKISVLIPVYNEEESIPILYAELKEVLKGLGHPYEIIFVDDGSRDGSREVIRKLKRRDDSIKLISFERNYGQSAALKVGFERAGGDIIITMDADLQNDPADIPRLLSYLQMGYDLVTGWRKERKDSLGKRVASLLANWIRNKITQEEIRDIGCMLKVYRREKVKELKLYNGLHRFLPTLLKMESAKVLEVEVSHRERKFGKSKYGIRNRMFKPFIDTLVVLWMKKNFIRPKIKEEI